MTTTSKGDTSQSDFLAMVAPGLSLMAEEMNMSLPPLGFNSKGDFIIGPYEVVALAELLAGNDYQRTFVMRATGALRRVQADRKRDQRK